MRRLLVFITVALSALAVPATSSAQRAVHLKDAIDISNSFQSPLLSGACGFPVTVTVSGALDETLIYNDAGLVVRQIENTPAATATFSSPDGSFSFPQAATSVYTYAGGATLGSTANFKSSGLLRFGLVPGFGVSNAGIDIVANAVVVDFTPEGIPMVDFTESTVVISHGNRNSDEEIFSAICAALARPSDDKRCRTRADERRPRLHGAEPAAVFWPIRPCYSCREVPDCHVGADTRSQGGALATALRRGCRISPAAACCSRKPAQMSRSKGRDTAPRQIGRGETPLAAAAPIYATASGKGSSAANRLAVSIRRVGDVRRKVKAPRPTAS